MKAKTTKTRSKYLYGYDLFIKAAIILALTLPVSAGTPIVATGNPTTDFEAIQSALDTGGEVVLMNGPNGEIFNLTGIEKSLNITHDVVVSGQDDSAGNMAKILANNALVITVPADTGGDETIAIKIDNPGGTVELTNLEIESDASIIILVGDFQPEATKDACKNLMITDCKVTGTHMLSKCVATWGCLYGTCSLEASQLIGSWCAGDFAWGAGLASNSQWEIQSNTLTATLTCVDIVGVMGLNMENSQCEGSGILYANAQKGQFIVKNNTMKVTGHQTWMYWANAFGIYATHDEGFSGGQISGNSIEMNPDEDMEYLIVPALSIAGYVAGIGAQGILVQDNAISGKADYGILVSDQASDNVIRRNNLANFTAVVVGLRGASQMAFGPLCRNNIIRNNIIGPLGAGATEGIKCFGDDNDFIRNDYSQSGISGLSAGDCPCLKLGYWYDSETGDLVDEPVGNLVFEVDLPSGTSIAEQVFDDTLESTGSTANTIIGY